MNYIKLLIHLNNGGVMTDRLENMLSFRNLNTNEFINEMHKDIKVKTTQNKIYSRNRQIDHLNQLIAKQKNHINDFEAKPKPSAAKVKFWEILAKIAGGSSYVTNKSQAVFYCSVNKEQNLEMKKAKLENMMNNLVLIQAALKNADDAAKAEK